MILMIKMKMLWINKSKVAYRYLPWWCFISTAVMWSFEFLKKTSWNWKEWWKGWGSIMKIPGGEKRQPLNTAARRYLRKTEARLWY